MLRPHATNRQRRASPGHRPLPCPLDQAPDHLHGPLEPFPFSPSPQGLLETGIYRHLHRGITPTLCTLPHGFCLLPAPSAGSTGAIPQAHTVHGVIRPSRARHISRISPLRLSDRPEPTSAISITSTNGRSNMAARAGRCSVAYEPTYGCGRLGLLAAFCGLWPVGAWWWMCDNCRLCPS